MILSGFVLPAVHFYSAVVVGHSDFEVVGMAVVVATLVGYKLLVDFAAVLVCVADEAYCLGSLGNPSPCS